MQYYASTLVPAPRVSNFTAWGTVYRSVGALYLVDILHFCWKCVRPRSTAIASKRWLPCVAMLRRQEKTSFVAPFDVPASNCCWSLAAASKRFIVCLVRPPRWLYRTLFGRRGLMHLESKHFPSVFVVRELIEAVAQCVQTYKFSLFITRPWINHVMALSLLADCWGTPLLLELVVQDARGRRLALLVSDVIVTISTAMVLPTVIFLPWAMQLDTQLDTFPATLLYDNKRFMQFMLESRAVLTISTGDCGSKAIMHIGILYSLRLIRRVVCQTMAGTPLSLRSLISRGARRGGLRSSLESALRRSRERMRHNQLSSAVHLTGQVLFFVLGTLVAAAHAHAFLAHNSHADGCRDVLHPWFVHAQPSCVTFEINCHRHRALTPNESAFSTVNPNAVQFLLVSHCPALVVPRALRSLRNLGGLELYNSTLLAWPTDAALDVENQRRMRYVGIVRVDMATFPAALLESLPTALNDIEFIATNLTELPEDLDRRWQTMEVVYVEHSLITVFPPVLLRLRSFQISLTGNQITSLPFGRAGEAEQLPFMLILSGNPITELPDSIASTLWMGLLFLERTRVAHPLPTWVTNGSAVTDGVYLWGTPFCAANDGSASRSVTKLDCDAPSVFAFGGYPLGFVDRNRADP
ncbi:hypothetical protein P43SY_003207 [Pythium insidiosum]|uniref:Uncharacterized protein n=1 Tax=Pythium insidiosum TaxID=114742 RepID=A0AAD5Q3Z8_PYTIN|nr:hypothetical protein P43SY_003207 [Pythium insidiosum]